MLWVSISAAFAWVVLLLFRYGFWRADQVLPEAPDPRVWPPVIAVIPARDEAETIGQVIASHMTSTYPGNFAVVVVDDHSTDGTRAAAETADNEARAFAVLRGKPLPAGWTGKLWAMAQGIEAVEEAMPEARYVLLTDADIVHAPDTVERLVAHAEHHSLAMVSLMARLRAKGIWGWLLVPAYVFFFQKLYPFPAVNNPHSSVAAAAGGCMLVRRDALRSFGGVRAIRGALIDDCALAAELKGSAGDGDRGRRAIWLGLAGREVISLRRTDRLGTMWETVVRTAFRQLSRSWFLLILCLLGMALLYLAGPVALFSYGIHGNLWAALFGAVAWVLSARAYAPTLRAYALPGVLAFLLPFSAAVFMLMTLDSARRDLAGKSSPWKGRTYSDLA